MEPRPAGAALDRRERAANSLVATVSHELRTGLHAIMGVTDIALSASPPPRERDYFTRLRSSGAHLLDLVNDLLDLSAIETGRLAMASAPFRLTQVLDDLTDMFLDAADSRGVALVRDLGPGVPDDLMGDSLRLRQVLANLLANALRATTAGEVRLTVRALCRDEESACLEFKVQDTGPGIPRDRRETVFLPFDRAGGVPSRDGGTGLGLSISLELVRLMGGDGISLESAEGQGSRFSFALRLGLAPQPVARDEPRAPAGAPNLSGRRILVADDNDVNRMILAEILAATGVDLESAQDGAQAVSMALAKPFDLVIMDLKMPGMDGLAASRAISRALGRRRPPILGLTAHAEAEGVQQALEAGMDGFLTKPVSRERLLEAICQKLQ